MADVERRRLLLVSHSSNRGGVEVCFDRTLRHFADSDRYDVLAAYPDGVFAGEWQDLAPRIPFYGSLPPTFRPKGYAGWFLRGFRNRGRLRRAIREWRPDVVVVASSVATSAVAAAAVEHVPCISYVRESVSPGWIRLRLWRYLLANSACVIANSNAAAGELRALDARVRIELVRDGVSIPAELPGMWPPSPPVVAYYGGYNPFKGAEVFVHAAARIAEQLPAVEFVFHGVPSPAQESYARKMRSMVRELGLADSLTFDVSGDYASSYRRTSLVALPSFSEGLPLVALEAMAQGVPVVASAVGGLPEIVDDTTGALVPSGDDAALATAIARLLDDERKLVERGVAARARVQGEFSAEATIDGLEGVLDRTLVSAW